MHDRQRKLAEIAEFGVRTSEFERETRKNF